MRFLIDHFNQWGFIAGLAAVAICLGYSDICHLYYTLVGDLIQDTKVEEIPNPNFVPPPTAKRFEIKLSHEPYLDSIQLYSMDDLGMIIDGPYEHILWDGNIIRIPFKARTASYIYVEYTYRQGDFIIPICEIITM